MRITSARLVFTLGVLLAINTMNFYDRQVLSAVQEKVRKEWELSDLDLGLLGTAFILLYAAIGLPLGRLADVWRRKWLLAGGVFVWSFFTFASGLAGNFAALFVCRLGVGVGEASCAPAASSLIGDLVPANRRARAMSLFMIGLPLGLGLSFLVSAEVAGRYGWQAAFFVAGAPGLLLAVLALFIADPPRGGAEGQPAEAAPPFRAVVRDVLSRPVMWWIIASGALHNFNMYALFTFLASLLFRYHEVSIEQAGRISALTSGFGAMGLFVGGWLGDRAFRAAGPAGRLRVAWIALACSIPYLLFALAAPAGEVWGCAAGLLHACLLMYFYYGTIYATIQDVTAPALRGTAMAVYFFAMYFLGAVLGPLGTGLLSDALARRSASGGPVGEWDKAVGLHDAMYMIPVLNVALVFVLIMAARAVKHRPEGLGEPHA